MKTTTRMLTSGSTAIEVEAASESSPAHARQSRLAQPLRALAAGAVSALSISFLRCDRRETNTYVHAESGSVVQVVNGTPAQGTP